jgi:hypothetical protein
MNTMAKNSPRYLETCGWCRTLLAAGRTKLGVIDSHRAGHPNDDRRIAEEYQRTAKQQREDVRRLIRESEDVLRRTRHP